MTLTGDPEGASRTQHRRTMDRRLEPKGSAGDRHTGPPNASLRRRSAALITSGSDPAAGSLLVTEPLPVAAGRPFGPPCLRVSCDSYRYSGPNAAQAR